MSSSCPICGRPTVERFKPFCSRHCADVDLGRWFQGVYRIPESDETKEGAPGALPPERDVLDRGEGLG